MNQNNLQSVQLYEAVKFYYDGIMGKKDQNYDSIQTNYKWTTNQIIMPKFANTYEYFLYHTPAIFHWIQNIDTSETLKLNDYLNGKVKQQKNTGNLKSILTQYAKKWQIAKLCFQANFYIKNAECPHISKKNVWSINYTFAFKKKSLQLQKYYCQTCKKWVKIQSELKKLPQVLFLNKYEQYLSKILNEQYELFICIPNQDGIWYEVKKEGSKVKSINQILKKKYQIYCYKKIRKQKDNEKLIIAKSQERKQQKQLQIQKQQKIETIRKKNEEQIDKKVEGIKKYKKLNIINRKEYVPALYDNDKDYEQSVKKLYPKQFERDEYDKQYDAGKVKKVKKKIQKHRIDFSKYYKVKQ